MKYIIIFLIITVLNVNSQTYPSFGPEIDVTINGLNFDAMEPFISADGHYLFFNNLNDGIDTKLYYALKVNDSTFNFVGELNGANQTMQPYLDAVADMDKLNNFYWTSTRDYPSELDNLHRGNFNSTSIENIKRVHGNFNKNTSGWLVMDHGISQDGQFLYYNNARFDDNACQGPCETEIGLAQKVNDSTFTKLSNSDEILHTINDENYIYYAPNISSDNLELYYTRYLKGTITPATLFEICVAVRNTPTDAFSEPRVLFSELLSNLIEAPTLTTDKNIIYYHKKQAGSHKIVMRYRDEVSNIITPIDFNIVKSEMTGAWYNPERSGEGILLEILDNDRALVTWYTYDQIGQQIWMLGVGDIDDNAITNMSMTITHGAKFGDDFLASDVVSETWGTLRLEFFACNTAKLIYNSSMGFGSGEIDLTRLTSIQNHNCNEKRNFLMGFTTFPPEASSQGVETAYQIIDDHADIIAQHFDDGVPWPEMLNAASFDALPMAVQGDWNDRKSRTKTKQKVYLAITPIAISRDQLAPYKGETPDTPLSEIGEPWASAAFDHPDVIQAYKNYAVTAIEFFHPDYLAIGIEVNLLSIKTPEKWQSYVNLNKQIYLYLHSLYPNLPIFDSFFANDLYPGITEADHSDQIARFKEIEPYTDYFALSVYPYLSSLLTNDVPTDFFKQLDAISTKPLAIAESGYMAQAITLDFGGGNVLSFEGTEQKQKDWIEFLLQQSEQRNFRFVINFINQDYDILCQQVGCSDADKLWINTGLFDENHNPRSALTVWDDYQQREIQK